MGDQTSDFRGHKSFCLSNEFSGSIPIFVALKTSFIVNMTTQKPLAFVVCVMLHYANYLVRIVEKVFSFLERGQLQLQMPLRQKESRRKVLSEGFPRKIRKRDPFAE